MIEQEFGAATVDVCQNGCRGMWFDWQELSRVEQQGGSGIAFEQAAQTEPSPPEAQQAVETRASVLLRCPRCDLELHKHPHRLAPEVLVDECYNCGGVFLDAGELKAI